MSATADLYDQHGDSLDVADSIFQNFGKTKVFSGVITTVRCFEDNSLVKTTVNEPGTGKVLIVDGGASRRCALLGDLLATAAVKNNWAGIIINGCIRDAAVIATLDIGVKALSTSPVRSVKRNLGQRDVTVQFAGVSFIPGKYVYADKDGIVISDEAPTPETAD